MPHSQQHSPVHVHGTQMQCYLISVLKIVLGRLTGQLSNPVALRLPRLPQEFVHQMGPKLLRLGRLLRFSIRSGGLLFNADGSPAGADLAYEGPANQRRGRADMFSKVLFQWQARRQPLQLDALLAAAAAGAQQQLGEAELQQSSSMADD